MKYEIEHRAPNRSNGRMANNRTTFEADSDKKALKAFNRAASYDKRGSLILRRIDGARMVRIQERNFD